MAVKCTNDVYNGSAWLDGSSTVHAVNYTAHYRLCTPQRTTCRALHSALLRSVECGD